MTASTTAARGKYEAVIGLEVHVQLLTESKIFCACSTRFGAPPNTNVCPVCLGLPGALPVLNRKAVEYAVRAAVALNCQVNQRSVFARKNYFYPDLPKGYQITQYDQPLAEHGHIEIRANGEPRRIGITRLHLEEDAGKSMHEGLPDSTERSHIDLNRSGVPLIEIVSEPELRSPREAFDYLTRLKEILFRSGVSDVSMEEGSLRCDANISVRPQGQSGLGAKSEVKNDNSYRFIREALEYEVERHVEALESGARIAEQTRLYDAAQGKTFTMRSKEQAHDYRYFPEPDLPPLIVDEAWLARIRADLPELPDAMRARLVRDYGITEYDASVLTGAAGLAAHFEEAVRHTMHHKRTANLIISELLGRLHASGLDITQSPISMKGLAMSADLAESGALTSKMLKDLYDLAFERGEDFPAVYEKEKPQQLTDIAAIERAIDEAMADNPAQLAQYRGGKLSVKAYFVGKVMNKTKGRANPGLVNELLNKKLPG